MKVEQIPLGMIGANCYFITADDGIVVIDPGEYEGVLEEKALPLAGEIKLILLTHRHWDHILGAYGLHMLTGAPVAIHELDKNALTDSSVCMGEARRLQGFAEKHTPFTPDILLTDGQVLESAGLIIKTVHTPGHSAGGVCYMIDDTLFTGDTLFAGTVGRTDFPSGDYSKLMESVARLAALPGDYVVYPGHGPSTTLSTERRTNPYMNNK